MRISGKCQWLDNGLTRSVAAYRPAAPRPGAESPQGYSPGRAQRPVFRRAGPTGREIHYFCCPRACASRCTQGYNLADFQPLESERRRWTQCQSWTGLVDFVSLLAQDWRRPKKQKVFTAKIYHQQIAGGQKTFYPFKTR